MSRFFQSLLGLGIPLFAMGLVLLAIENIFYQTVDANGISQESLFLPLGIFSLVIGTLLSVIRLIVTIIVRMRKFKT